MFPKQERRLLMKDIVAILPAREFDYNLQNKNLLPFLGTNLLMHKIEQLKKVKNLKQIIVASESETILSMAEQEGVSIFKRPKLNEKEDTLSNLVNTILPAIEASDILWTSCCTPFIDENLFSKTIDVYDNKIQEGYDSLITVLPFKRYVIDDNGAVNFRKGLAHRETSKLSQLYFWINGITIASKENMLKWSYLWGDIPYKFFLDKKESIEIKNLEDLKMAEIVENKEQKDV